jgi:hypothetical protein
MSQKNPQNPLIENKKSYSCEYCNYITANKKDYGKHENTNKHKKNVTFGVTNVTNPNHTLPKQYCCENCGDNFKHRMALSRHKKLCISDDNEDEIVTSNRFTSNQDVVMQLIQQNKELQDVLREQSKAIMDQNNKLIEISTKSNTTLIQNNTTTNNTTNNNSFNLNLFLNEQCKDAISITDFVDSLNLNVGDLEATGKLGYVLGISRIFINKLKELDVYERPLHCTDYKRETVYIKNQDTWEKDNSEKSKLRTIVSRIARKNLEQLPAWQAENPDYVRSDTPENNEYMKISLSSLGGYSNEEENKHVEKIMRNVLKEVTVDKNALTDS